jgi:hypothetical protein
MSKWQKEHPIEAAIYRRKWALDNPEKEMENDKRRYQRDRTKRAAANKKWNDSHRELLRERANAKNREIRKDVLKHYGDRCACCGETEPKFLAIDHINGRGDKNNRDKRVTASFYRWIQKNDYPKDLQILCHNCNCAKGFYGECPHQSFKIKELFNSEVVVVIAK